MINKNIFNTKGFTLIELVISMAIFGLIVMITYPMLSFTFKTADVQLKDSNQRNEVRLVSTHLKKDIEYSKEISILDTSNLTIIDNEGKTISYYLTNDSGSSNYLVRETDSTHEFREISDIRFEKVNDHLIKATIITDVANNKSYSFDIFRWNTIIDLPDIVEEIKTVIIKDKVFMMGNQVVLNKDSTVSGTDATVIIKENFNLEDGNVQYITTKKIYIEGNVSLDKSSGLGKMDNTSSIYINGDVALTDKANLYGTVFVEGNFNTTSYELFGNIYVDGDFSILDGNYNQFKRMSGHVYYTGNLSKPHNFGSIPATKVESIEDFEFPSIDIPPMNTEAWYIQNGYTSNPAPRSNMKYYGDDITLQGNGNSSFSNVILASKGNIYIGTNMNITGILFAPDGQVTIDKNSSFRGLIIANKTIVFSNSDVTFEPVEIDELPF